MTADPAAESSPAEGAPDVGALARIPGALFSPGSTFEAIARRPTWIPPVVLWTILSVAIAAVLVPRIDYEKLTRRAMEKRGQTVSEDRLQSIVEQQKKIGGAFTYAISACTPVVITLLVAAVLLGSFKAFGWELTFKQSLGAAAHAFLPGMVGAILLLVLLPRRETVDPSAIGDLLRSNLGFLVERDSAKALHSLLGSLDLFSIWSLVLFSIGYSAAAKIRRGQAAAVVVSLWAVFVLARAGLAAVF
jgi:Yip1 domain